MINEYQEYAISKFLKRYDYNAVLEILEECGVISGDLYFLTMSCAYSINFNFDKSLECILKVSEKNLNKEGISNIKSNLENLKNGHPEEILSELIENIKIQIINKEYIDFLGRLYRVKESLLKYIFVTTKEGATKDVNMNSYSLSKKNILYLLKKKYNIYNSNLMHGINNYVNRYLKKDNKLEKAIKILNNQRLENLMHLRNDSPIGHGFKGVSKEEIEEIYANPLDVMQDLVKTCELLNLEIKIDKYDNINEFIIHMLGRKENYY